MDSIVLIEGKPPEECSKEVLVEAVKAFAQIAEGKAKRIDKLDSHLKTEKYND